jgi:hypothetical protein
MAVSSVRLMVDFRCRRGGLSAVALEAGVPWASGVLLRDSRPGRHQIYEGTS